jgi:hypothetical protein
MTIIAIVGEMVLHLSVIIGAGVALYIWALIFMGAI